MDAVSEQFRREGGDLGAFALGQVDAGEDVMSAHLAGDMGQAAGPPGEEPIIDLVRVPGDEDPGVPPGTRQLCLHLGGW